MSWLVNTSSAHKNILPNTSVHYHDYFALVINEYTQRALVTYWAQFSSCLKGSPCCQNPPMGTKEYLCQNMTK